MHWSYVWYNLCEISYNLLASVYMQHKHQHQLRLGPLRLTAKWHSEAQEYNGAVTISP